MSFSEFAEMMSHKWISTKKTDATVIDEVTKPKIPDMSHQLWLLGV